MTKQKKKKPTDQRKKNLRRHNLIFSRQTEYHLLEICAYKGWPEKDMGRAVDFVTREYQNAKGGGSGHYYRCPTCGYRVDVTDRYCRECGEKLNWRK